MGDKDIVLTKVQQNCVDYPEEKNLLVRGIAGSGKSLVLERRALKIFMKNKMKETPPSIALFTYTNSLVNFMKESIADLDLDGGKFEISTLDKEIFSLFSLFKNSVSPVEKAYSFTNNRKAPKTAAVYEDVLKHYEVAFKGWRFWGKELRDYLEDELQWMKQHQLTSLVDYIDCDRKGRGKVRLSMDDKSKMYSIYDSLYSELELNNLYDINMICNYIIDHADEIPDSYKYDYVMIDEAQDLAVNKLKIARILTKHSMTISADFAQKIYKTGFTWKEVGIDIKGSASKKLKGTYRNTKEIAELANCLKDNNSELKNMSEDEYNRQELPDRHGNIPSLIYEDSSEQEKKDVIKLISDILDERPDTRIAILAYNKNFEYELKKWFKGSKIPFQIISKKMENTILSPGVKIVTFHSSKGLEFDTVIIPHIEKGIFMPRKRKDFEEDESEAREDYLNLARNLLYVGMTRAKFQLYMFTVKNENEAAFPSPLLEELDEGMMKVQRL